MKADRFFPGAERGTERGERERDAMVVQIFALFREMLLPMSLSTRGEHIRVCNAENAISSIRGRDLGFG